MIMFFRGTYIKNVYAYILEDVNILSELSQFIQFQMKLFKETFIVKVFIIPISDNLGCSLVDAFSGLQLQVNKSTIDLSLLFEYSGIISGN